MSTPPHAAGRARKARHESQKPAKGPEAVIDFLEAVYRMDTDDETWLRSLTDAALRVWGRSSIANVVLYDASDINQFKLVNSYMHNMSAEEAGVIFDSLRLFTPAYVARHFRSTLVSAGRDKYPELRPMFDQLATHGFSDCLSINGLDPSGCGVHLGLIAREPLATVPATATYRRMAQHLSAAYRCRRRLAARHTASTQGAEAVIDERGRLVHAEGPAANKSSQSSILAAARVRARALDREPNSGDSVSLWSPLTEARWTLVDSFAVDGERYVVARENRARIPGLVALSERERQVLVHVALGQSSKEAAYALGISDSTARVLLARAATKLGARSRAELLEHPEVRALLEPRPPDDEDASR